MRCSIWQNLNSPGQLANESPPTHAAQSGRLVDDLSTNFLGSLFWGEAPTWTNTMNSCDYPGRCSPRTHKSLRPHPGETPDCSDPALLLPSPTLLAHAASISLTSPQPSVPGLRLRKSHLVLTALRAASRLFQGREKSPPAQGSGTSISPAAKNLFKNLFLHKAILMHMLRYRRALRTLW